MSPVPRPSATIVEGWRAASGGLLMEAGLREGLFGWKKSRLECTDSELTIGARQHSVGEISHVGYWALKHAVEGIPMPTERYFAFSTTSGHKRTLRLLSASFEGRTGRTAGHELWSQLIAFSGQFVEPRLCDEAMGLMLGGTTLHYSGRRVHMNHSGFGIRRPTGVRWYGWPQFRGTRVDPEGIEIFACTSAGDAPRRVGTVPLVGWNTILLPNLMPLCTRSFG